MLKAESKLLKWIGDNVFLFAVIGVTFIGGMIRYYLRFIESADYTYFLLPWYDTIKAEGGFAALRNQVGNYSIVYQFLIAIMTYIPIKALYAYKILSILFDYILSGIIGYAVYDLVPQNKKWNGFGAYTVTLLLPTVFLDSAAWAQCDSIYVTFVMLAVICLLKEKHWMSFIFLGVAFAFKLQAIFIIPFFCYIYFMKRRFTFFNFLLVPVTMCIVSIPGLLLGMRSVWDVFGIYTEQVNTYPFMYMNYPSFWVLLANMDSTYYDILKNLAIMLTFAILALMMIFYFIKRVELNFENMIYMAFLTTYTCVLFLPSMHERYDYLYIILGIILLFMDKRTLPLFLALSLNSVFTYGSFLFTIGYNLKILAVFNLIVYFVYSYLFLRKITKKELKSIV